MSNTQELKRDRRQQTSNSVKAHRLGGHLDLNIPEALPRERGKEPTTRSACNVHEFDENKVDARVKTHWCGDLMLYVNIAMLYDGERRELVSAVRMVKGLNNFPLHSPLKLKSTMM